MTELFFKRKKLKIEKFFCLDNLNCLDNLKKYLNTLSFEKLAWSHQAFFEGRQLTLPVN